MTSTFKSAMLAAAQLTAAGDLNAATAAIQRALMDNASVSSAPVPTGTAPASGFPGAATRWGRGVPGQRPPGDVVDIEAKWVPDATDATDATDETAPKDVGQAAQADIAPGKGARVDVDQGTSIAGAFGVAAQRREYLLYLPRAAAATAAGLPLVVMLHGCTQTPADFAAGTAMNALADRHGFLVLYPAQSRAANQSSCWNWFNPNDQRADSGEPAIIAGMVRDIVGRYELDRSRIYVAGLSAGGAMAAILGNAYPDLFAAVAVHSGLPSGAAHDLPSALAAMKRGAATLRPSGPGPGAAAATKAVPTIVFHGRQDRTVHPANATQIVDAALSAWPEGALAVRHESGRAPGGRSYTRTIHQNTAGVPMVEQWEVQGAGHAWSGGDVKGSYTDPQGPDASSAMMDFFLAR